MDQDKFNIDFQLLLANSIGSITTGARCQNNSPYTNSSWWPTTTGNLLFAQPPEELFYVFEYVAELLRSIQLIQLQQQVPGSVTQVLPSVATIVQAAHSLQASRSGNVSPYSNFLTRLPFVRSKKDC